MHVIYAFEIEEKTEIIRLYNDRAVVSPKLEKWQNRRNPGRKPIAPVMPRMPERTIRG